MGTEDSKITASPGTLPPECPGGCQAVDKPIVDTAATIYVIFGLKAIDRSKITREHVIEKKVNLSSLRASVIFSYVSKIFMCKSER